MSAPTATSVALHVDGLVLPRGPGSSCARSRSTSRRERSRLCSGQTAPASRRSSWRWPASCARRQGASCSATTISRAGGPERSGRRRGRGARGPETAHDLTIADNLRVATYSLSQEEADSGTSTRSTASRAEEAWDVPGRSLSGGEQQMVVLAQALCRVPSSSRRRALARARAGHRQAPRSHARAVAASGVAVLLIEQFAHVALGLAARRTCSRAAGSATTAPPRSSRENRDLLHSAYLLRDAPSIDGGLSAPGGRA